MGDFLAVYNLDYLGILDRFGSVWLVAFEWLQGLDVEAMWPEAVSDMLSPAQVTGLRRFWNHAAEVLEATEPWDNIPRRLISGGIRK